MKPAPMIAASVGGRRRALDPGVRLQGGGREEDLHQLAGDVGHGELPEEPGLALEAFPDAGGQAVAHRFDGEQRRGVVAAGAAQDLPAGGAEHERPAGRGPIEQQAGESARTGAPRPPAVHHPLRRGQRDRPQQRGVHQLVHHAEPERLLGALGLAGEDHVEGGTRADQPWQALAPASAGEDAELDLRQADLRLRMIGGDPIVAREGELEAPAETRAVDADGDGLREARHPVEHVLAVGREPFRLGRRTELRELLDVGTGDEVVGLPREERDGTDARVLLQRLEAADELLLDRARDGIDRRALPVEGDDGDPVPDLPGQGGRGHERRSSTIAEAMPPCAHTDTRPNRTSRRFISFASVVTRRPPVAPNGWPIAMDPPMTLMIASSMSQPRAVHPWKFESTCEANASWTSIRPRSRHPMPARSSASGTALIGAWSSCHPGSTAATA
jgi:hypothetical protein